MLFHFYIIRASDCQVFGLHVCILSELHIARYLVYMFKTSFRLPGVWYTRYQSFRLPGIWNTSLCIIRALDCKVFGILVWNQLQIARYFVYMLLSSILSVTLTPSIAKKTTDKRRVNQYLNRCSENKNGIAIYFQTEVWSCIVWTSH